ncbi:MAG TPA: DUF935 family protein [Opitutaceae bacterium]|nr:DUF935 family protein [Opitutaceae bacterium]HRJ48851.1 DUF935 family protein [Opitutaceae bacterium]
MKIQIAKKVREYLASLIPVRRRTIFDVRTIHTAMAASLSVDDVHDMLRAAESGNTDRLFQLYMEIVISDSHIQGRLADRKEAVTSDTLSVQPYDKKNADDVRAAELVKLELTQHDDWDVACNHLLDAVLWPVAVVEKTFKPSLVPGLRYQLGSLTIVPQQLLTYMDGRLQLKETDTLGRPNATRLDPEETRYIIHRGHLLSAVPDNWGGPMRSIVFWWLLSAMGRDWWARFLDRYGAPFLVGKYDQADDDSRTIMERAFALCTKLGAIVVSKETDVEIKQAAASDSGQAYQVFVELCNREKSKLILGETLSSDAQATGMNSGTSAAQGEKRQDKRQSDARRLGACLRTQLIKQFLQINGIPGRPPTLVWGAISATEQAAMAQTLTSIAGAGLEIADEGIPVIGERLGIPVQRASRPAAMPGLGGITPFSAAATLNARKKGVAAIDTISEASRADLARAFTGELAPIARIILDSVSPEEAVRDVATYCAEHFDPSKAARVMEEALLAIAANGAATATR